SPRGEDRDAGRMKSWRQRAMVGVLVVGVFAAERHAVAAERLADGAAAGARLAPSADGHLGAWLVAGPFDHALSPVDEPPSPRLDDPVGPAANVTNVTNATGATGAAP